MKKFIAYSIIFSLVLSNTAFAAKELIDANDSNPLVRFKPIVNGYYAKDDWYIDSSTGAIHGPNEQTNLNKSRTFNDLTNRAISHSPEALAALFQHANVYLRGDRLDLFLPLKGGGGGSRFIVEVRPRPRHIRTVRPDEIGIGTGRPSTRPPTNPRISGPSNSGPSQRAPIKSRGPVNNGPSEQEKAQAKKAQSQAEKQHLQKQYGNTIANDYEKAQHVQHLINTVSWEAVYQYADSNGISREKVAFISQNRTGLNFDKYMRGTNTFHGEYEKADRVRKLINTATWKAVYDYADSNSISRENVAYINQNRGLLHFESYMRQTNPTYAMYDQAKHIQHLINTTSWENVWSFAESKGISKAQVMQGINGRRTEDLSFTLKATNIHGEIAYINPLLNNGLVYPVKQTTEPNPEQLLPSGYQHNENTEALGEMLVDKFLKYGPKAVKSLWCGTIGVCDADAHTGMLIEALPATLETLGVASGSLLKSGFLENIDAKIKQDLINQGIIVEEQIAGIPSLQKEVSDHNKRVERGEDLFVHVATGMPDPDDSFDEDTARHNQADYHHQNSKGLKSKAPTDPDRYLKGSVRYSKNSKHRINVDPINKEFIYYSRTARGDYHSHVRTWKQLTPKQRAILKDMQKVDKKGNIV